MVRPVAASILRGTGRAASRRSSPAGVRWMVTDRSSSALAFAAYQAGRLQALEERGEGAGVQPELFADGLDRLGAVLPQDQHDQVLGVGQAQVLEGVPVDAAEGARGGVQREADLVVEAEQFGVGDRGPGRRGHGVQVSSP